MFTIAVLLSGAVVGLALFFIVLLLPYSSKYYFQNPPSEKETIPIQILVLGDIGRSPRMQYHAISAGKHGARVEIIGYRGMRIQDGRCDESTGLMKTRIRAASGSGSQSIDFRGAFAGFPIILKNR